MMLSLGFLIYQTVDLVSLYWWTLYTMKSYPRENERFFACSIIKDFDAIWFEEQNNGIEEEEQINLHSDVGEEEAGE